MRELVALFLTGAVIRRATCFAAAIVVHVVLLNLVIDIHARHDERVVPPTVGQSTRALRVVFIESDSRSEPSFIPGLLASAIEVTRHTHIHVTAPDIRPLLADSFEASQEVLTVDDVGEAQRLQKSYVGQISARLVRVLEELRATSPSTAPCLVDVVQDERGSVLDVLMDQCEADAVWQGAVGRAIRQSSPLPLPPQGLAMGSYLTLDVSSMLRVTGVERTAD